MKIFQHIDEYHPLDGIGNDCRGFRKIFDELSISNFIVTKRNFSINEENILNIHDSIKSNSNDVHILHYGGCGYPLDNFLKIPGRKILRFHNITPAEFYLGCKEGVYLSMERFYTKSIIELSSLSNLIEIALCDSNTNAELLKQVSSISTLTIPILRNYSKLVVRDNKNTEISNNLFNKKSNDLIFVGRFVPNKKIEDCIILFYFWNKIHSNAKLHLVGGTVPGIEEYYQFLLSWIKELSLEESIIFHFKKSDTEKIALLEQSLFYISMSEHEGFGIPLLEAMQTETIVLAFAQTAVPETMKSGGILFNQKNFIMIAELMDTIQKDLEFQKRILKSQDKALLYYENFPYRQTINSILYDQNYLKKTGT
jgi:glycosyltransferase involved in cell wall biosynthesis